MITNTAFRPATAQEFQEQFPRFTGRFASALGGSLWELLNTPEACAYMECATLNHDLPAVAGIARLVADKLLAVPEAERNGTRQLIGCLVATIMRANGWQTTGVKGNVPPFPVRLFARAEMYVPA